MTPTVNEIGITYNCSSVIVVTIVGLASSQPTSTELVDLLIAAVAWVQAEAQEDDA